MMNRAHFPFLGIIALAFVLAGCQQTAPTGITTQENTTTETRETAQKGGVTVYQLNPDGTSQEVMKVGEEKKNPGVMEGVKGMVITKDGFVPSSLTFKAGTKLIIENRDDADHWPASEPHPVHTLCPGFDAKKPLKKGEAFEFTFEKAGTCPFHDHLNPGTKGTITVTE